MQKKISKEPKKTHICGKTFREKGKIESKTKSALNKHCFKKNSKEDKEESDLEKVVNCPQAENSVLQNVKHFSHV